MNIPMFSVVQNSLKVPSCYKGTELLIFIHLEKENVYKYNYSILYRYSIQWLERFKKKDFSFNMMVEFFPPSLSSRGNALAFRERAFKSLVLRN